MAKTELTREEAQATAIGEYKFGFHDDMVPFFRTHTAIAFDQLVLKIFRSGGFLR